MRKVEKSGVRNIAIFCSRSHRSVQRSILIPHELLKYLSSSRLHLQKLGQCGPQKRFFPSREYSRYFWAKESGNPCRFLVVAVCDFTKF